VFCVDKKCQFTGQLRTLIPHLNDKHPYLNVEFRSRKSEYFQHFCNKCQYYFHSRSALYTHRLKPEECTQNKARLDNYRQFTENVGRPGQEQILMNMRKSIKMNEREAHQSPTGQATVGAQKRKSSTPIVIVDSLTGSDTKKPKIDESNQRCSPAPVIEELDSSIDSEPSPTKKIKIDDNLVKGDQTFETMQKCQKRDEFSCDYCSNNVSFPIFNLLIVHIKSEHANKYIQFRIKKTAQVPFRCQKCNFCFPDEKTYIRHIKKSCDKNLKLFEEYTQSLENDEEDEDEK
jgi:uncharacterized C2H2 Zn-finger protein